MSEEKNPQESTCSAPHSVLPGSSSRSAHYASLRPRETLLERGADFMTDAELLSVILGTGTARKGVMQLSEDLLVQFGGLRGLLRASNEVLRRAEGLGNARIATLRASLALTERYLRAGLADRDVISDPTVTRAYLRQKLRHYEREVFACLFLDNQHRVIEYEELFFGTIDAATVHPREVVKRLLAVNAAAVIFAHNHPSGIAEPSQADQRITARLVSACALVDVRVLDHLVVGDTDIVSFAERGLLN